MDVNVKKNQGLNTGFTLIEILVVIGIIAILAAVVLIAINPARQFAQARNSQRTANVNTILNAIGQRLADNKGLYRVSTDAVCTDVMDIPAAAIDEGTAVTIGTGSGNVNMRPCLVPTYVPELPVDPKNGIAWDGTNYNTEYKIFRDSNSRITVCAPQAITETAISASPPKVCITR